FLSYPRKDTLAAGSLDARVDSGKFLLECLADLLGKLKVGRGIPGELAFLGRRRDQRRCYCSRRRWRCAQRRRINKRQRRCGSQNVAARGSATAHSEARSGAAACLCGAVARSATAGG